MTTRERFKREQRELVARLTAELTQMRTNLVALEATGQGGDLRAMFLREGIPATEYRLQLETEELTAVMPDMRFLARNHKEKK